MGGQQSGLSSWLSLSASYVPLHMSLDLSILAFFTYKAGITTLISKGLGIDEKHIAHCEDIRKVSRSPTWAVCVFEAHLAPERTEGSLCLTFTAAQLYQHDAPAARAGDSPGD